MNRYWFVSYHFLDWSGRSGFGNAYVRIGDKLFNLKSINEVLTSKYECIKSIVILNYFEVDEATFNENV